MCTSIYLVSCSIEMSCVGLDIDAEAGEDGFFSTRPLAHVDY